MIAIVCLDESRGMLFNHRRQSRDLAVTDRIGRICRGKKVWMNSYSYPVYGALEQVEIAVDPDFVGKAGQGDYCLVETECLEPVQEKLEGLLVFWWNRKYPADFYLDLDLSQWKKVEAQEFSGVSHEKITEEFYVKAERI
ncbi:ribonuclease Z [Hominifimenecus sp. rT4P-3]|uniref:ribonuclease Z n=1 Tax=Hominifimenecus sp. rT4P-3 TaxID=3242979 RepID=UPI003DA5DE18